MEKCEWKDGGFYPCEVHKEMIENNGTFMYFNTGRISYSASFCPSCGADIRKPVVEPIIKRSGETLVARYYGVDYLCIRPAQYESYGELDIKNFFKRITEFGDVWKPFSEIESTDEIAKLRPMVTCGGKTVYKLIAVESELCIIVTEHGHIDDCPIDDTRLAKVEDLED